MLADYRHPQIRPVLAAVLLGQSKSIVTRTIGTAPSLAEQSLPLRSRQTTVGEIRPGPFPPVIKKPHVIIFLFERLDLPVDEGIQRGQVVSESGRQFEGHRLGSPSR